MASTTISEPLVEFRFSWKLLWRVYISMQSADSLFRDSMMRDNLEDEIWLWFIYVWFLLNLKFYIDTILSLPSISRFIVVFHAISSLFCCVMRWRALLLGVSGYTWCWFQVRCRKRRGTLLCSAAPFCCLLMQVHDCDKSQLQFFTESHKCIKWISDLSGNWNNISTTVRATTYTHGRLSFAKPLTGWLCERWPSLHVQGDALQLGPCFNSWLSWPLLSHLLAVPPKSLPSLPSSTLPPPHPISDLSCVCFCLVLNVMTYCRQCWLHVRIFTPSRTLHPVRSYAFLLTLDF